MAITYVGHRVTPGGINNGVGATQAVTVGSNATAGNTVFMFFANRHPTKTGWSIADTRSNTWVLDLVFSESTTNCLGIIARTVMNGGTLVTSDVVTVTAPSTMSNARIWYLEEFSGLLIPVAPDVQQDNFNVSSTNATTGATAATAQAEELSLSLFVADGGPTITAMSSTEFVAGGVTESGTGDLHNRTANAGYDILAAVGAQNESATIGSAQSWHAGIQTYLGPVPVIPVAWFTAP